MSVSEQIRSEHAWCLQLRESQAFRFYLRELDKKFRVAMRETTAEHPEGSRDYHAGRLSALTEASTLVEKLYQDRAKQVERIES